MPKLPCLTQVLAWSAASCTAANACMPSLIEPGMRHQVLSLTGRNSQQCFGTEQVAEQGMELTSKMGECRKVALGLGLALAVEAWPCSSRSGAANVGTQMACVEDRCGLEGHQHSTPSSTYWLLTSDIAIQSNPIQAHPMQADLI